MDSKMCKIIKKPSLLFLTLGHRGFFNWMDDETYLKIAYRIKMGKKLNLKAPETFNEKLQWLKLHDRNPLYTNLVDKYEAKKYVAEKIGEQYIIPTLGVWNHFDEIDFDTLPNQFVLKCTHDSGGLVIVKDKEKLDKKAAKHKIESCLKHNFFWGQREWPYKNIRPRIIAEQYLEDDLISEELIDYKLMCFNGKVKCSFTCTNRYSKDGLRVTFYDYNWNKMPFERKYPADEVGVPKPRTYKKMVQFAEKLSEELTFSRIDFYELGDKLYFGEITFYPGSGFEQFKPIEWDYKLGSMLILPSQRISS